MPVVKVNTIEERPGGAANVAMNIASLGANARLVGLTGIDDTARALSKSLAGNQRQYDFVSVRRHIRPLPKLQCFPQPTADPSGF